ncbi:hypothetical protein AAHB37_04840 [Glutamicibacter halophytocola]|uniref:maltokinase N-terminal cap-like domain-containing protein n=1 Tax=Glutamicibacter halophytocola TaxID=1933880 RepID=UPI00321BB98E
MSTTPVCRQAKTSWSPLGPPKQEFYTGKGTPKLQHIGGFRLEDPEGQVGVEPRIYADHSDTSDVVYHLPLTYRDAPLPGGEKYLIGTSEHAILGKRYIYDAAGDPVFTAQARQLLAGNTTARSTIPSPSPMIRGSRSMATLPARTR